MVNFRKRVLDCTDFIIKARRELHRIPETAYTEEETSAYVADCLAEGGLEVRTGIAQYGVVGVLKTGNPGPTLLIRADMDALPLSEATDLPFASDHDGVMHACGHDGHMAMVLGAARVIKKIANELGLKGNIKFLFQPAEEWPGGAKPMIEAGVMENPTVDFCVGCHLWPGLAQGNIGVKAGPLMAAMGRFDIKIIGKGGHAAMPHLCVDALEVGSQVISALQRIVSRRMNPLKPTVVTVASFHAGSAFNVIPGEAHLSGTTRTFDRKIWESWRERLEEIVRGVCQAFGADYELGYTQGYPPLVNDPELADIVAQCAARVVGKERVVEPDLSMGSEDMAFFLENSKGCYFYLGVGHEGGAPLHSPTFAFNEEVLLLGVETYCRISAGLLK